MHDQLNGHQLDVRNRQPGIVPSIGKYTGNTVKLGYFCHTEYNLEIP